jgi:hypothetical protein
MKKFMITSILLTLFATGATLMAQNQREESLGLPGDNLNLYAVMKLFQESETLEVFERSLNDPDSKINNLDLNGDNLVDYIRVIDNVDGEVHNIVLQVAINRRENQDVAVFTVQRDPNGRVYIQLTGDEALYGRNYIIEPILDDAAGQTPNPGYLGNNQVIDGRNVTVYGTTAFEIAAWPLIRFIYYPGYYPWHSSWYYGYYPPYWRPWRPFYWDFYYGYHYNWYNDYYSHYRICDYHRYNRWNDYYWSGRRSYSENVSTRIQSGSYRNTYSRPDQRRAGETAYLRSNPDQNRRAVSESSGNSTARRSESRPISDRQPVDNINSRRSTNSVTNRSVTNPESRQNDVTTRRSANTMESRYGLNSQTRQNEVTTRRSPNAETSRSVTNPQTRQNDVTNRQSGNTMASRYGSKPQSERSTVITRSPRQSSSTRESVSGPRSSSGTKSEGTSNNSGRSKSSETSKESRRR